METWRYSRGGRLPKHEEKMDSEDSNLLLEMLCLAGGEYSSIWIGKISGDLRLLCFKYLEKMSQIGLNFVALSYSKGNGRATYTRYHKVFPHQPRLANRANSRLAL